MGIGDKVFYIGYKKYENYGIGKIIFIGLGQYLVEFDKWMGGHSGDGRGKNGHCWWAIGENLIKLKDIQII